MSSEIIRTSKLHLVDLAGSERCIKSKVEGKILSEAKYISKSLTFPEQVWLYMKGNRQHIPYSNRSLTTILRDSLGGNCKTCLITTMHIDINHIEETSRFVLRCSMQLK